jgi:hypothetical protein
MWTLLNCFLSGRHDYGMWCEPGAIFLRCVHCGKRSSGWAVEARPHSAVLPATTPAALAGSGRVAPFDRAAAS